MQASGLTLVPSIRIQAGFLLGNKKMYPEPLHTIFTI